MKIKSFYSSKTQMARLGCHSWSVARLFELSKNMPILEIPLDHLNICHTYESVTIRDMIMHINAIKNADLSYPIIIDEDGEILDGRHRIMKAILEGANSIKAVKFDENPTPCRVDDKIKGI